MDIRLSEDLVFKAIFFFTATQHIWRLCIVQHAHLIPFLKIGRAEAEATR